MYIKVLFFGYIREVTMKRNIFVLFVITMITICISSCSNSFDVSSNRISEIETRNVQRLISLYAL